MTGFQLIFRCGSVAGSEGMNCSHHAPPGPCQPGQLYAMVGPNVRHGDDEATRHIAQQSATNVAISTMPLPPISSRSDSTWGMWRVDGAKRRQMQPIEKGAASGMVHVGREEPQAASAMMPISNP